MAMAKDLERTKVKTKMETASEGKAVSKREYEVRKEIIAKETEVEKSYVDLSWLLKEADEKEYHVGWGFDSFELWADKELQMGYRKAKDFVAIAKSCEGAGVTKADLAKLGIGWSKMARMATLLTEKNAKRWLDKAGKMTLRELGEAVKISRRPDARRRDEIPTISTMKLTMEESEYKTIMEAIGVAKEVGETKSDVLALEMICQDWMEYKGASPKATSLEDHVKYLERVYPVKLSFKELSKKEMEKRKTEEAEKTPEPEEKAQTGKTEKKAKKDKGDGKEEDAEPAEKGGSEEDIQSLIGNIV